MSKYEIDVWEYADEFKNLDTNETFGGYAVCELLEQKDQQIAELQKQLEEKEKDNQFLKKMYLSERAKNDNYHTEKYALDKPVEELRKIKLTPKEKEIYYKGFDNCERQFATHIAELQQELKSQPAEIVEKIRKSIHYYPIALLDSDKEPRIKTLGISKEVLDTILEKYQK